MPGCSKHNDESSFPVVRKKLGLPELPKDPPPAPIQPAKAAESKPPATNAPPSIASTATKAAALTPITTATIESPYKDELAWLVTEITQDIVEMCWYAKNGSLAGLKQPAVKLEHEKNPSQLSFKDPCVEKVTVNFGTETIGPVSLTIEGVWTPKSYTAFARSILEKCGPGPSAVGVDGSKDETALRALLEQPLAGIEQQNQRISKLLSENMHNADAHEEAALILGTLALRESAGLFSDQRREMNRMTAHLAMAEVLRDQHIPSTAGRFADAALMALSGRGAELVSAVERAKKEPGITDAQKTWCRALYKINTDDWREPVDQSKEPFLLQFAQVRALGRAVSEHRMLDYLEKAKPAADWARLMLDLGNSVHTGHVFGPIALQLELKELSEVWQAYYGQAMPENDYAKAFNPLPGRCVQSGEGGKAAVKVLDWGTWASHFQRHMCQQNLAVMVFLRDLWGVPEQAEEFWKNTTSQFSGLRFFPLVERQLMKKPTLKEYRDVMDRMIAVCKTHPELITVFEWKALLEKPVFAKVPDEMPRMSQWFTMRVLPGTCYHPGGTLFHLKHLYDPDKDDMVVLKNRNPYSFWVSEKYAWVKFRASMGADNYAEAYGPLREYQLGVMSDEAHSYFVNPDKYRDAYTKVCELDPDRYLDLGEYLVKNDRQDQAVEAYQKAVDLAPGRVGVSNGVDWLVNYYYDHNNTKKALEVADMAADVYSYRGLETKAKLMERMKNYVEAEKLYAAIDERYDDKRIVFKFYERAFRATNDPTWQQKMDAIRGGKPVTP